MGRENVSQSFSFYVDVATVLFGAHQLVGRPAAAAKTKQEKQTFSLITHIAFVDINTFTHGAARVVKRAPMLNTNILRKQAYLC